MKHQHSILALVAILTTATLATDTGEQPPVPHEEARQAVQTQIVSRLSSSVPPFSRARAPIPQPHFHQFVMVDGEKRLPFEVKEIGLMGDMSTMVTGYVRLSDQMIFIFDPKTQRHIHSHLDPRFAPEKTEASSEKPT